MKKNPNKTAGNWGALKTKPQNLVPFKSGGRVKVTAGGEKHVIYKKTVKKGEGKVGNIMANHPTKDKGIWDTIDLTKKAGAKTIKQGVAATKKWHKENPKVPKGYHIMPGGKLMKDSAHKKSTKK
jgi:hypothetical protein